MAINHKISRFKNVLILTLIIYFLSIFVVGIKGGFAASPSSKRVGSKSSTKLLVCGEKIVFTKLTNNLQDIYTINVDGTNEDRLTNTPGADNLQPKFSPDCSKIAFTTTRHGPTGKRNTEIYVMDFNGDSQTRKTNHLAHDEWPAWSPDGTKIVFASDRNTEKYQIYTMDADDVEKNVTQITTDSFYSWAPDWSFQGEIAYHQIAAGKIRIYVMDSDGGDNHPITLITEASQFPSWSPNGDKITYQSNRYDPSSSYREIYTMNSDGSNPTRCTFSPNDNEESPSWSSNGTQIVFSSNRNGNYDIFTMDSNCSNPTTPTPKTTDLRDENSPDM